MRDAIVVVAMCLLAGAVVDAQTTGTLEGTVLGEGGRPVAGVIVTARHVATNTPYRVTTNELGQYRFPNLPPGTFEVTTADVPSLGPRAQTVTIAMGAATTANFDPATPVAVIKEQPGSGPQAVRFEASGRLGWTFSEGVATRREIEAGDGNVYTRIDPVDSISWGFTFGVFLTPRLELEFLFDRQESTLQASGTSTFDIADMGIGNYHGILSYHFGAPTRALRFYVFGGAGATSYTSLTFTGPEGESREIGGRTRMSATFGGGGKIYGGRVGARVEARMTPTYIRSTADGWWCDPYWGCYLGEESQYSNQFQVSGGITFRF